MGNGLCNLPLTTTIKGYTRGMLENRLTLKHSFQPWDVDDSSFVTGSRVPAFNIIESRRPNLFIVEEIADFAVLS
jgi:hypothetical protein